MEEMSGDMKRVKGGRDNTDRQRVDKDATEMR